MAHNPVRMPLLACDAVAVPTVAVLGWVQIRRGAENCVLTKAHHGQT
jgi:hypothetical protein